MNFTRRSSLELRIIVEQSATMNPGDWLPIATFYPDSNTWMGSASIQEMNDGDITHVSIEFDDDSPVSGQSQFIRLSIHPDE
ncbi:MAG: hypothetical protein LR015_06840 [Verrucomicrobia bacterium]|nr:hypothetical protein [Verrucomicrobiota bacterium]